MYYTMLRHKPNDRFFNLSNTGSNYVRGGCNVQENYTLHSQ